MALRTLKGFFRFPDLEDNRQDYVSRFGELSTEAETFSRDKRVYANKAKYPYPSLVAFSYKNEFGEQSTTNPTSTWQEYVLSIGQWIMSRYVANQIPVEANRAQFWSAITSEFTEPVWTGMGVISNITNVAKNLPEWISFDLSDGGNTISTKIWLSDPVFQAQYDEWTTVVIPPADPIDLVNQEISIVTNIVKDRDNIVTINNLINDAKKNARDANKLDPETKVSTLQTMYYDPTQEGVFAKHTFTLVHYGAMGLDYENQKSAIRDYLSANSDLTIWPKIYPELFNETDFAVIPTWDSTAINQTGDSFSLYSSSVPIGKIKSNMKKFAPAGFSNTSNIDQFIETNCSATSVLYRGMICGVMGSPNNKDQIFKLTQLYGDYMHASTEQADFSRMKTQTQEFVKTLNQALGIAFSANNNTTIPNGFTKQFRGNRLFISFLSGGFQWLVLSRLSYNAG